MDLVINLAPTGMIPTRAMTSHVPITPGEIADDVLSCHQLGITAAHLHARDRSGAPTSDPSIYAEIIRRIRQRAPDLVLCVSCSGRLVPDVERRAQVLDLEDDLKPDLASLTLSSLNFPRAASVNAPDTVKELARRMLDRGIKPELEVFDLGMIHYAKYMIDRGLLAPPFFFNLMLGNVAGAQADLLHIGLMVRELPADSIWSLGGIGTAGLPALATAVAHGGGVRVGIEDDIWFDGNRDHLATNRRLVERAHDLARLLGRRPMAPSTLREILGLSRRSPSSGTY